MIKLNMSENMLSFYKSVVRMVGVRAVIIIISFVGSIILTRQLGADGRGLIAWFVSLSSIAMIVVEFGMGMVNKRYIAEDESVAGNLVVLTIKLCAIGSVVIAPLAFYYGILDDIGQNNINMLFVAVVSIFFMAIFPTAGMALLGLHRVKAFNSCMAIQKISNTLFIIALFLFGLISPLSAIIVLLFSYVLQGILTVFLLRKEISSRNKSIRHVMLKLKSYMFYNYIAGIFGMLSISIVPMWLASSYSLESAGWFAACMVITDAITRTFGMLSMYAMPKLASMQDVDERIRLRVSIQRISFWVMSVIAIIFIIISSWLIPFLFGAAFIGAVPVFRWLCVGMVFLSLKQVMHAIITSETKGMLIISAPASLLIVVVISSYFLIDLYGAVGGALSLVLGNFIAMLVAWVSCRILLVKNR